MKEKMTVEEMVIQEVISELIDITNPLTYQEIFMHLKIP
jgi:hypothetical protein